MPIIIDGGILRSQDVLRAIALGAGAVAISLPTPYGSPLWGAQGVQALHNHLKTEREWSCGSPARDDQKCHP